MWHPTDFQRNAFTFNVNNTPTSTLFSLHLENPNGMINYDRIPDDFNDMVHEQIYREIAFLSNLSIVTPRYRELSTRRVQLVLRDMATNRTISYHANEPLYLGDLSYANVEELLERKNLANSGEEIDITSIEILIMVITPVSGGSGYTSYAAMPPDIRKIADQDKGLYHLSWLREPGINCAALCLAILRYKASTRNLRRDNHLPLSVKNMAWEIQTSNNWNPNQLVSRERVLQAFEDLPPLRKPARLTVLGPAQMKTQQGMYFTRQTTNFQPNARGTDAYYMILSNNHWTITNTPARKNTSFKWCHVCCSYYNKHAIQDPNDRTKKVKPCRCNLPEKKKRPLQTKDVCSCPFKKYRKKRNHRCFLYSKLDSDHPRVFKPYIPGVSTHYDNHLFAFDVESMIVEGEGVGDYFVTNNHEFTFTPNGGIETERRRRSHHVVNAICIKDVFSDFKMYFSGENALDEFIEALAAIPGFILK
jgi:hypothetical protein